MNRNAPDDVDPIVVAGCDDGEILDETDDGAIACVADGDGMTVRVDPDSELGEQLSWLAGHRGVSPDALLAEAIQEQVDAERADGGGGGPAVRCPNGHEFTRDEAAGGSFDGDGARWQCPDCGEWTEGPPPG